VCGIRGRGHVKKIKKKKKNLYMDLLILNFEGRGSWNYRVGNHRTK
jgi:hypothetical protein